jgi:acyl carrier protein
MELENRVKEIIGRVLDLSPENIRNDASLKDDLGATSLDRYTILMDIEDAFSLDLDEIPEEELEDKVNSIADILTFLKEQTAS